MSLLATSQVCRISYFSYATELAFSVTYIHGGSVLLVLYGEMLPATRVVLWAAPKTVSTAFERSMRTLDHCKVFHEPYVGPCYIREDQYSSGQLLLGASYEETTLNLMKDYPCCLSKN